jgi:hypothetical protein
MSAPPHAEILIGRARPSETRRSNHAPINRLTEVLFRA